MKRFIVSLTVLTTSLSSFAQELSDKDKLINNSAMETLRAIETDPEHENNILNNQPAEVRDLSLSLKEQGLKSTDYIKTESGVYLYIGSNSNNNLSADGLYETVKNHKCVKPFGSPVCMMNQGAVCIRNRYTSICTL